MHFKLLVSLLPLLSAIPWTIAAAIIEETTCQPYTRDLAQVEKDEVILIKTNFKTPIAKYNGKVAKLRESSYWNNWCSFTIVSIESNTMGNKPYSLIQYDSTGRLYSNNEDNIVFSVAWKSVDGKSTNNRYYNAPKNGKCRVQLEDNDFINSSSFDTMTATIGPDY